MMARKTLLLLASDRLHAWRWSRGKLSFAQSFANDTDGLQQLSAFLKGNRDPAYLLADLSEEDYRLETLPHLRGSDRFDLIQRKLGQFYLNTPFRQAILQRRRNDGRRDDDVLFSALPNPSHISPWLDIMLAGQTAIAGIYSVPGISAPLVAVAASRHLLLVSWEKQVGLRQTYFDSKFLRFSRLTAIHQNSFCSETISDEVEHTRQYLLNLNLLPQNQELDVRVICHENQWHELEARLADCANLRCTCMGLKELGRRIKSSSDYSDSDATPLFLHLLATRRFKNHYAAPAHTHYFRLSQLRRGLNVSSTILAAGSLLWSATNVVEGNKLISDRTSIIAATNKLTQRTEQIVRQSPDSVVTANDMKTAVLLLRKLAGTFPAPQPVLNELSMTLNDFPAIRVVKLAWQTDAAPRAAQSEESASHASNQDVILTGELEKSGAPDLDRPGYVDEFRQALIARGHDATAMSLPPDPGFDRSSTQPLDTAFMLKIKWSSAP